ncbi:hypothetical protein [Aeromicrobium sp. Leaf350]|uniref:hypothetical protein n=1 Tax=Aeromicrobium sp. Leaf350 TaxID=2876565 RepID=UPI001E608EC0|nr:hypothetical protein [Aeromicrobium sp. Leaf350]
METKRPVRVEVTWGHADDEQLLRRAVATALGTGLDQVVESRVCPACGASDHGRPVVRLAGPAPSPRAGHVSLSRHDDVAVVAWCEDAAVGVDVDGPGREGWVQHEARGKCAGSGITAPPPEHLVARSLTTPPGCVAAVAVDTDGPWEVVVR